jgi:hypothetical protein
MALAFAAAGPGRADPFPTDTPVTQDGLELVCTGIAESKLDPRWPAYPIRVEFSNAGAQYLDGATVTLSQSGKAVTRVDCLASWVLMKLTPGATYSVAATLDGASAKPRSATFKVPATGQKRVVLQFSDIPPNR